MKLFEKLVNRHPDNNVIRETPESPAPFSLVYVNRPMPGDAAMTRFVATGFEYVLPTPISGAGMVPTNAYHFSPMGAAPMPMNAKPIDVTGATAGPGIRQSGADLLYWLAKGRG